MPSGKVTALAVGSGGKIYAAGELFTSAGGVALSESFAVWGGAAWGAVDINLPGTGEAHGLTTTDEGDLMLGWGTAGAATAPGQTAATNSGSSNAYPVIQLTSPGALYSLENLTTGQIIRFSGTAITGETLIVDLRPGRKTVKTPIRDLAGWVVPGSDLAAWCLAPGTNVIALHCSNTSVVGSMYWRPKHWSSD
jgi:hypothetical protein